MKTMNKVIALIIMMAITIAMPAMAGNGKKNPNGNKNKVVVVTNGRRDVHAPKADMHDPHAPKVDMRDPRFNAPHKPIYRPDVRTCVIKLGRHDSHKKVVAKAEHMKGVMDAKWNPRTREVIVRYDANVTSARHILHFMA
ncbi:MAG: hypothetical protein IKN15_06745 [Bacteroidaceae bacterium]|nr:hypothetical protein [Bacteroidaceae bacterium]